MCTLTVPMLYRGWPGLKLDINLWFYRGVTKLSPCDRTGHEFVGAVEAVGSDVRSVRPGDSVISPFASSDGTCEFCQSGLQTSCNRGRFLRR
jgi:D-arabinose 1-dehydrogenase-like Zn-dependent alcohol dehydrogenase